MNFHIKECMDWNS